MNFLLGYLEEVNIERDFALKDTAWHVSIGLLFLVFFILTFHFWTEHGAQNKKKNKRNYLFSFSSTFYFFSFLYSMLHWE